MDRRQFLKRLGFLTAALPLAGFKPKEDETVPDIIEIDGVTEEESEEIIPERFDKPYYVDTKWAKAVWLPAPEGGYIFHHELGDISDWDADDEA